MRPMSRVVADRSAIACAVVGIFLAVGLPSAVAGVQLSRGAVTGPPAAAGDQLWASRYDGPGSDTSRATDSARAVAVGPGGNRVFVTGWAIGAAGNADFATVAYTASQGQQLWVQSYDSPWQLDDTAVAVAVSPDGARVFVTGPSAGAGGSTDYATVAYDSATGAQLWAVRYDAAQRDDVPVGLRVSPDGSRVFVAGSSSESRSGSWDYLTVAYDAATGSELWTARYDGPYVSYSYDYVAALGISPDGSKVFVTGFSPGPTYEDNYTTIAYDAATGASLWTARFHTPGSDDRPRALGVSPDGSNVFVTGPTLIGNNTTTYATIAYDAASGAQVWAQLYHDPDPKAANYTPAALVVGTGGHRVFVTGNRVGWDSPHPISYLTLAYSVGKGTQLWARRYGPSGTDTAAALGIKPDGSQLYVTGTTGRVGDYGTVAYDTASGTQLWAARYDNGQVDNAAGIAVAPDGSQLFVTGRSYGTSQTKYDYATVAYSTAAARDGASASSRTIGANSAAKQTNLSAPSPDTPDSLVKLFSNGSSGAPVSSQNFEAQYDAYDDQAADDFLVPVGHTWKVKQLIVLGHYYNGPGKAASENVSFYEDAGGLPGALEASFGGVVGKETIPGYFKINLPTTADLSGGTTGSGTVYWVSVQANMDFGSAGQWGWDDSANNFGFEAAWQNPGDGFGTGCTTWAHETDCLGGSQPQSKAFTLKGYDTVP
jgi:PQQ-like domain